MRLHIPLSVAAIVALLGCGAGDSQKLPTPSSNAASSLTAS